MDFAKGCGEHGREAHGCFSFSYQVSLYSNSGEKLVTEKNK